MFILNFRNMLSQKQKKNLFETILLEKLELRMKQKQN